MTFLSNSEASKQTIAPTCMLCGADGVLEPLVDFIEAATKAKYCMTFLVFSVFPAPDSPLQRYFGDRLHS